VECTDATRLAGRPCAAVRFGAGSGIGKGVDSDASTGRGADPGAGPGADPGADSSAIPSPYAKGVAAAYSTEVRSTDSNDDPIAVWANRFPDRAGSAVAGCAAMARSNSSQESIIFLTFKTIRQNLKTSWPQTIVNFDAACAVRARGPFMRAAEQP